MLLTVDGRPVHAATGGRPLDAPLDAGGPVAVLLHGSGMDNTVWALQSRFLAHRGVGVLSVDLPGHGRSAGPPLPTVEALGEWVVALLDAAGVGRALLAGHSLGALVALAAAGRAPERVGALALLGAADRMPVHPGLLAAATAGEAEAIRMVVGWAFARRAHIGGSPAPGMWMVGAALRLMEREAPGVLGVDLGACDRFADAPRIAAAIACPTTVVIGSADRMTPPKAGRRLAALIPGAEIVELPGVGHMMAVEAPEATARALLGAATRQERT
ncbi:alpha/beta hydrolase [Arenibaculum sp.]|uniref:alpha/beta fold hydrolase n=1 Tax=Arenibaculum sp. TaxID=2865862 RepID=UPI002E132E40|nr:alpha/beta hydrolase [Arenibaculum sp.]